MRILRIAQKLYPEVKGGGPYHVHALSRDQAAMGHDVTVLTVRRDPNRPRIEERDGYTVVRRDSAVELFGNSVSTGVGRYLLCADEFDVMHAHSHLYFSTNLAALSRWFSETPLAITNHGLYSQNAPEWMFDLYLRTLGRWTFESSDVIFCYTKTDERRLRSYGIETPIDIVSNGIDTKRFTPDGAQSEHATDDGPIVLFVGRLVTGKQPEITIDAIERVREEHPNVELWICGQGPLETALRKRAEKKGLADTVNFLGQIPYDEMPKVYRSADALVLPSRAEGLPRVVLEAFATGVPAVTSDLTQLRDVVPHFGAIVSENSGIRFGDALNTLLSSGKTTEEVSDGRELVLRDYQWKDTVKQTTDRLARIVDREQSL